MENNKNDIEKYTREVMMTILHIMRNMRHSGIEMMADVELSFPQLLVLFLLYEKGVVSMGEISDWLKISEGVTTRTVDRLAEKDFVLRKREEKDRRVVSVTLSVKGREFVERTLKSHLKGVTEIFRGLSSEKRKFFLELLEQVDRQLEGLSRSGGE